MQSPLSSPVPIGRAAILGAANALHMVGTETQSPARLITMLCDDDMSADELAAKIEAHPVLSVRVLKVANSSYYGQVKTVSTVKRALLLLGSNAVRGIAAAACVGQVVPRRVVALPDMSAFMKHSLATAIACEMLAMRVHPVLASDAFIAGLLHNLGTLIQATLDPVGLAAIIRARSADPSLDIRSLELQLAKLTHEDCAAVLFDAWCLPDSLVSSAQHHHDPSRAPEAHRSLAGLVAAGGSVALGCGHTYSLEPTARACDAQAMSSFGMQSQDFEAVSRELPGRVELFRQSLG
jgi:HD-like signal output (HDOD) protein